LRVADDSATTVGTSAALDIADAVGIKTAVETGSAEATILFEKPSDEVEEFVKVLATEVTKDRKVLLVGGDVRAVYDGLVAGPVTVGYMVITELATP
jgi:hypothetical protein